MLVDTDLHSCEKKFRDLPEKEQTISRLQVMLAESDPQIQRMARALFPYWVMANEDIEPRKMPFVSVTSGRAFEFALAVTLIQLRFILAHEFAHVFLGHFDRQAKSVEERTSIEKEADEFAFYYLSEQAKWEGGVDLEMLWVASRWLFRYQFCEMVAGQILRGNSLDPSGLPLSERQAELYTYSKENRGGITRLIGEHGYFVLLALTGALRNKGLKVLPSLVSEFASLSVEQLQKFGWESGLDAGDEIGSDEGRWWKSL
ncbi:MAG: hypothetical protein AAF412_10430 [Pseudomonadota bacterium]